MKTAGVLIGLLLSGLTAFSQPSVSNELSKSELAHISNDANQYTYQGTAYGNIVDVTIQKTGTGPNLFPLTTNNAYLSEGIWIGKSNNAIDYSDIMITFSSPVTKLSFIITSFNNDFSGQEEIQDLRIFNPENVNITKTASFKWLTGSVSGFPVSAAGATAFNDLTKTISAAPGKCCDQASGRLMIESQTPFTKLVFRHQDLGTRPDANGIVLSGPMDFSVVALQPVAINDHLFASHNTEVIHTITANDFDSNGTINHETIDLDPHEIGIRTVKQVEGGVFRVQKEGNVTFTPNPGFTGTSHIDYTVKNSKNKTSNIATWKVVVGPDAKNDIAITSVNTAIHFEVCLNDVDVEAIDPSTIDLNPNIDGQQTGLTIKEGTFKVDNNGSVLFEPVKDFIGNVSASYTVKDAKGAQSKVAKIDITVLGYFYYDQAKYEVNAKAKKELDKLAALFQQYPNMKMELDSHTDCMGAIEDNQALSQKRADAIISYLIKKGVPENQLIGKGYGESNLAVRCTCDGDATCTEKENQKNRRTEIKVLSLE